MTQEMLPTLELWYDRPALTWLEALPIGNGRLGAMLYGGTAVERIQLNESTLWAGGPHNYANPGGPDILEKVRELVFAEQWAAATELAETGLTGLPACEAAYQTVGELVLTFDGIDNDDVTHYRRSLNLDSSICDAEFTAGDARYSRQTFASYPDQVIVTRISANNPGKVSLTAHFSSPQTTISEISDGRLIMYGLSGDAPCGPGQVRFCAIAEFRVENDAFSLTAAEDGQRVGIRDADSVVILISIATSYRNYLDVSGNPELIARGHLERASECSFDLLVSHHVLDHQNLFRRLSIRLGGEDEGGANIATDARIARNAERNDPALAALYCQYGRYLTIAGSRPNGMPTTLQGLWNDRLAPAWDSKYTININTEMNYWLTATGNLPECCLPLFELTKNASLSGARTAAAQYGASGWVAHHNLDAWMGTSVVDRVFHGMWPTGGAWLCKSIWDHYEYTGDREMLSQNYELLKGASLFFIDTLVEHPEKKWLVTCPSNSPENAHHTDVSICAGPAMDMSILRDLFAATAEASKILNIDGDFRDEVLRARERLAPLQIGSTGKLQEWLDDWDDIAPEQDHRHVSHLYALYPSSQITVNENPEFAEACRQTLIARGDESTGWATAWRIALWARLYEAEHAHKILSFLLTPERTAPNMFDLHPPFQIDGNFGGAAAILEMLVQSHEVSESGERIVRLLPALPKSWDEGKVAGVLVRGGFEVGIIWTNGVLEAVTIKSLLGNHAIVSYNGKLLAMDLGAGETCGIEWSGKELRKLPASY